jgi:hypothetical protein
MTMYRAAAALAICCLAGAAVTACSANLTNLRPNGGQHSSGPASSPPSGGGSPAAHQDAKIGLGGQLGNFPVPPGARVTTKIISQSGDILMLSGVKPEQAASFYTSALPGAGYTISNSITSSNGILITFTGHGYRGGVFGAAGASSWFPASMSNLDFHGMSTPQLSGNQVTIMLKPQ